MSRFDSSRISRDYRQMLHRGTVWLLCWLCLCCTELFAQPVDHHGIALESLRVENRSLHAPLKAESDIYLKQYFSNTLKDKTLYLAEPRSYAGPCTWFPFISVSIKAPDGKRGTFHGVPINLGSYSKSSQQCPPSFMKLAPYPSQAYSFEVDLSELTLEQRWAWWGFPDWLPGEYEVTFTYDFPGNWALKNPVDLQIWKSELGKLENSDDKSAIPWKGTFSSRQKFRVENDSIYGQRPAADEEPRGVSHGTHVAFYRAGRVTRERIYRGGILGFEFFPDLPRETPAQWQWQLLNAGTNEALGVWLPTDQSVSGSATIYTKGSSHDSIQRVASVRFLKGQLSGPACYTANRINTCGEFKFGQREGEWLKKSDSTIQSKAQYLAGNRMGEWLDYYPDGSIGKRVHYADDILEGESVEFYPTGAVKERGSYHLGERHGIWKSWHENGTLASEFGYERGQTSGEVKCWYSTGQASLERIPLPGTQRMNLKGYDKMGTLLLEGQFILQESKPYPIGAWTWRDSVGHVVAHGNYDDKHSVGTFIQMPDLRRHVVGPILLLDVKHGVASVPKPYTGNVPPIWWTITNDLLGDIRCPE